MKLLIIMLSLGLISGCVPSSKTTKNKMENAATSNRLINASSPYLLQHAYNPVDWYPWGEEALLKAKNEDKPILVIIGYSSCHWCHVMAHESFENDSIAALMNANFVNIKIDREERPDIDQIYMEAVQAMGINGGPTMTEVLRLRVSSDRAFLSTQNESWSSLQTVIGPRLRITTR